MEAQIENPLNRILHLAAPFQGFLCPGFSAEKEGPQLQDAGHIRNGTTYKVARFDFGGLVF